MVKDSVFYVVTTTDNVKHLVPVADLICGSTAGKLAKEWPDANITIERRGDKSTYYVPLARYHEGMELGMSPLVISFGRSSATPYDFWSAACERNPTISNFMDKMLKMKGAEIEAMRAIKEIERYDYNMIIDIAHQFDGLATQSKEIWELSTVFVDTSALSSTSSTHTTQTLSLFPSNTDSPFSLLSL